MMTALDERLVPRRAPVGAEVIENDGVHFRVWAPLRRRVDVVADTVLHPLKPEGDGYFSGWAAGLEAGYLYRYRLDGADSFPDPASRFQPEGPHGQSQIIDPDSFTWTDRSWGGLELKGQVIYELHIGTFTKLGTWESAARELPQLARTGITVIELMPVADFSGRFGWGYDAVNWYAPSRLYGTPDDMRRFVDAAHSLGIGVILDVVYNHFGPDGNYSGEFSPYYVSEKHKTDWGDAINFDGPNSGPVREFVSANAAYWIREFHLDGLRLDATQNIYDDSPEHILSVIGRSVRQAAGNRKTIVVAENEPQETRLVRPAERGGYALDGLWNDDYHHTALVALTGRREAYYTDYSGTPQEFISAAKYGFLYQGQWYHWQKQRRGTSTRGVPPDAFINFIENHDQVANSARGLRAHQVSSPGDLRAMTVYTLLAPGTPMLFQGQEFGASAPFLFFVDMPDWLLDQIRAGRKEFMSQWRSIRTQEMLDCLIDPCRTETFLRCKLDHSERSKNSQLYKLHCDAIRLKKTDPILRNYESVDGAVLDTRAFVLRYFGLQQDRLLVVNLGTDLSLNPAPEPLLAPPDGSRWKTVLSSEAVEYGGMGVPDVDAEESNWLIPGHTAIFLATVPSEETKEQ